MEQPNSVKKEDEQLKEDFSKWQQRTQDMRSATINLFLTISIATIGFTISQVISKDFKFTNPTAKFFLPVDGIFLLLAIILFLSTTLTRLESFRITAQIVKARREKQKDKIPEFRKKSRCLDNCSSTLFYIGVIAFGIGEISAIIGFVAESLNKFYEVAQPLAK